VPIEIHPDDIALVASVLDASVEMCKKAHIDTSSATASEVFEALLKLHLARHKTP
jgi:hypothetical protein